MRREEGMLKMMADTDDLMKLLDSVPPVSRFPSQCELMEKVTGLAKNRAFQVRSIGESKNGMPIHSVRWGRGETKALIVGFPHPNEPVGAVSVLSLFHLFESQSEKMMGDRVEWNIIPCIDPEGMLLNQGWMTQEFSFESFMKYFYRQKVDEQVEWSFPVDYKRFSFTRPTHETKVLMSAINDIRPDFYMPLHNFMAGGAYYYLGGEDRQRYIPRLTSLVSDLGLQFYITDAQASWVETLAPAFYGEVTAKAQYDYFSQIFENPEGRMASGGSSFDYLKEINPAVRTLVAELPYVQHEKMNSKRKTGFSKRHLALRADCSTKLTDSLLVDAWADVANELDVTSPFYSQAKTIASIDSKSLSQISPKIFLDNSYLDLADEGEYLENHLFQYYALCRHYQFVRLLHASRGSEKIEKHLRILTAHFDARLYEIDSAVDFSSFDVIPLQKLVKCQIGSALIYLENHVPD